ncbi:MAG TPA: hypothetical protein VE462_02415 [Propionibacteriaceae bacterium]|nr:hypothetical protein [Propionibacteriaceae bacterium]
MRSVVVSARLDRRALLEWCQRRLGTEPVQVLFQTGYLSQVIGLRLIDGRDLVVKVRAWQQRLTGCGQVQHSLSAGGFPAPRLLVPPERLGQLGVSAEALVHGGDLLAAEWDSAARFADALALLVSTAPHPATVGTLAPSPAWVGWDHSAKQLWPAPDDREGDLNKHSADRWLDEIGEAARTLLLALDRPAVIGHGDWYSQNLRWVDRRLHVVHDWDSVVAQPEAAIAGQAAAMWPGTGLPGEVATLKQSEQFLIAYEDASGQAWTDHDVRAAWAAGLWTRAFDAKKASLVGADPAAALTKSEAKERSRLAGL